MGLQRRHRKGSFKIHAKCQPLHTYVKRVVVPTETVENSLVWADVLLNNIVGRLPLWDRLGRRNEFSNRLRELPAREFGSDVECGGLEEPVDKLT